MFLTGNFFNSYEIKYLDEILTLISKCKQFLLRLRQYLLCDFGFPNN